jgi:methenyltetrahydromethanopterin cyclohydrolase
MNQPSVNKLALDVVKKMDKKQELINVIFTELRNGATVIDCGMEAKGGLLAGKYVTEICIGGLGKAYLTTMDIEENTLPAITVVTDNPPIALLASQLAGWKVKGAEGKIYGYASGPARASALKPKNLLPNYEFSQLDYQDKADVAVVFLEPMKDRLPREAEAEFVAENCGISPDHCYMVVAPTNSMSGSVQVSGRVVEMGIYKMASLGYDPKKVMYGIGTAPIAPVNPDEQKAMSQTNDMILYGGKTFYEVNDDESDDLNAFVTKIPSAASKDYGEPFYDVFKKANFDFFNVDPGLFSPAAVVLSSLRTDKSVSAGKVNTAVLLKSLNMQKL